MDPCMQLGVFGKRLKLPPKLCQNGLHLLVGPAVGRTTTGLFCRQCRQLTRLRQYYRAELDRYWIQIGLKPVTSVADSSLDKKNHRAAPTGLGKEADTAACITPQGGSASSG